MRDNGGCEVPNIDFLLAKNVGIQWDFDVYGNSVPWPKPDELFQTYKVENKMYFTISTIRTNQEDLMDMDVYIFDIFVEGKFESHGGITSRIRI